MPAAGLNADATAEVHTPWHCPPRCGANCVCYFTPFPDGSQSASCMSQSDATDSTHMAATTLCFRPSPAPLPHPTPPVLSREWVVVSG